MSFQGFGSGSGFGVSGASSGVSFGSSNAGTKSLNTNLTIATSQTTTSSQATTTGGFSFGTATSTGASTLGSGLFGAQTSASTLGTGLSFGGATAIPGTSSGLTLNTLTQAKSQPEFKGLGGVDLGSSNSSNNGSGNKNGGVSQAVKDQAVPDEICKDVKAFEEYVAKQKEESNEVGKFSVQSLHKISEEISSLSVALATISSAVQRNKAAVEKLRAEFGEQLNHAEMAQRTQNTPAALQHDNVAPIRYFAELVTNFDTSMQLYRQQIDELENHLHSLSQTNMLTPQDISIALVKIQETFITLASNLHSIHDNVKHLKEQYLAYRRVVHGDTTDVFEVHKENQVDAVKRSPRTQGPPPFQNLSNVAALAMASMLQQPQQQQQAQHAPPQQSFLKPSFGSTGGSNIFGTSNTSTSNIFGGKRSSAGGSLFGTKSSSGNLFGSTSTTSSGFGFASSNTLKPALSAGFNKSSSSGNVFFGSNTTFNSSAGVTFGGAAAAQPPFDLKPPPNNKRNKK